MRFCRAASLLAAASASIALLGGCRASPEPDRRVDQATAVEALRTFEKDRRKSTDFSRQPSSDRVLGPEPYVVLRVGARPNDRASEQAAEPRDEDGFVGLLRNADRVVLLDSDLHETARADAPPLASALALGARGEILVGGQGSGIVLRYAIDRAKLLPLAPLDLRVGSPTRSIRALAVHPSGTVLAVDEAADELLIAPVDGTPPTSRALPKGPFRLSVTQHFAVVLSLLDHTFLVMALDARGLPAGEPRLVRHDGPMWSVAAEERDAGLVIAIGGVEDHPLDRTGGSFGYIDSYLYLYGVTRGERPERLSAINLGERGIVTPKAIAFTDAGQGILVTGYGAPRGLELLFPTGVDGVDFAAKPRETPLSLPPGAASIAIASRDSFAVADPLLDAWVLVSKERAEVVTVSADPAGDVAAREHTSARDPASRLGEALFFTTLMAPWAKSDGPLSRFTCETCHFEGGVDGRTHNTGRGAVVATTKPLMGLFNNAPHFTRALDKDMAGMVDAEFRVASANSGHDAWFSLDEAIRESNAPRGAAMVPRDWLADLSRDGRPFDGTPEGLRRALMEFLMDFTPRPTRAALDRSSFSALEEQGVRAFERRCASCHAPRLVADDPSSVVASADWESLVFGSTDDLTSGTIVWARDGYEKTGIEPYVHPNGARPSSLRRLRERRPYFTNGSSASLDDLLDRARFSDETFFHDATKAPPSASLGSLSSDERTALRAFLELF